MSDCDALLESLQRLASGVPSASAADRVQRARQAAEVIRRAGGFHWVGLYDVEPDAIVAIAWAGDRPPAFPRFPRAHGEDVAAVAEGAPAVADHVARDVRRETTFDNTRAELIVPVRGLSGEVVGTIDVESTAAVAFGPAQQELVEHCARALGPLWAG